MFHTFFLNKKWLHWSLLGTFVMIIVTWYKVQLDVSINKWFKTFYDTIQTAISKPNTITFHDFLIQCLAFAKITVLWVVLAVILEFFVRHYVFRWRTAMSDFYLSNWKKIRHIEGASQRIQEDTMRFARLVESLSGSFLNSVLTLIAFLPILWQLSAYVTELPWIGKIHDSLIFLALILAASGTVFLALVGIKLPGLEFKNQKVEAAYRKELVLGEDQAQRADAPKINELFFNLRKNYFVLYRNYLYFDIAKWSYLQFTTIVPYIMLGPTIVAGVVTLGIINQTIRAFDTVKRSLEFLVYSWSSIVELMSIYKRLKAFELVIHKNSLS